MKCKYDLSARVELVESSEQGVVKGRAEYVDNEPSYLILYKAADGRQVESWWGESALKLA